MNNDICFEVGLGLGLGLGFGFDFNARTHARMHARYFQKNKQKILFHGSLNLRLHCC